MSPSVLARVAALLVLPLACACSIVRVDSEDDPPRIESNGLIDGHAAVGIPSEPHLLHLRLFNGTSDGAIAEVAVWKLLRAEVGLLGASLGVGPFHLGLGTFFYEPQVPEMVGHEREEERPADDAEPRFPDDEIELEYEVHPSR